jgi:endo-1,4-beta-xylanase
MKFRGHNLLWANTGQTYYQPDFIMNEQNATKIDKFMADYIEATVTYFKGKAFAWDVVNEAISDSGSEYIRKSPYAKVDDFICKAF